MSRGGSPMRAALPCTPRRSDMASSCDAWWRTEQLRRIYVRETARLVGSVRWQRADDGSYGVWTDHAGWPAIVVTRDQLAG